MQKSPTSPLWKATQTSRHTIACLSIWNFQSGGRYIFMAFNVFATLPGSPHHTNFQIYNYLALDLEFSKGGRYIFMVFTTLPASPPEKPHKLPDIQLPGSRFGIFKAGGGTFSKFMLFTTLQASPSRKNRTSFQIYNYLALDLEFSKGGRYIFMVFTTLPASPPEKPHKLPDIQLPGSRFGIFKAGGGTFSKFMLFTTLQASPSRKNRTSFQIYNYLALDLEFSKGGGTFSWYLPHFQPPPLKNHTSFQIYNYLALGLEFSKKGGGTFSKFMLFTTLQASPSRKNRTSFQIYNYLALDLEFSKGGRYIFMVFTTLPASPPEKPHKLPDIQLPGSRFGIFKAGGGTFSKFMLFTTLQASPSRKNRTNFQKYSYPSPGLESFHMLHGTRVLWTKSIEMPFGIFQFPPPPLNSIIDSGVMC